MDDAHERIDERTRTEATKTNGRLGAFSLLLHWAAFCLFALPMGCTEGEDTFLGCPIDEANSVTAEIMQDVYFWNDEPTQWSKYTDLDPLQFRDPDALLDFLRYLPDVFDRYFTYIDSVEADEAFNAGDSFYMFGFLFDVDEEDAMVLNLIIPGSPAELAGLERGDRILSINGRRIAEIEAREGIDAALGFYAPGTTRTFEVEGQDFLSYALELTTAAVPLPSVVPLPADLADPIIFDVPGGRTVGYLPFLLFIDTAPAVLDELFAAFALAGVTDLVVDLRYSPGGLLTVADHLGALLAGPANTGEVQYRLIANSANSANDFTWTYPAVPAAQRVALDSVVFITTGGTASAGELVMNGLDVAASGIDVVLVGARTFGKPVGSPAIDFCEDRLRLRPIAYEVVNGEGSGGYFDGLPVDCPAVDDRNYALGDPNEDSLATALYYIENGSCPLVAIAGAATEGGRVERPRREEARTWLKPRGSL